MHAGDSKVTAAGTRLERSLNIAAEKAGPSSRCAARRSQRIGLLPRRRRACYEGEAPTPGAARTVRRRSGTGEEATMADESHSLRSRTAAAHRAMKDTADVVGEFLVEAFHLLALFAIGATTVWSAIVAFVGMVEQGHARLEDILLLFIYLEIGAMVGIYFKTTHLPVRYLIYIAITALGRVLIEIVGAEHRTGMDLLYITGAILILAITVLVLRFGSYRYPSDMREPDTK
jgi:phosphate starvation-inducible membrane PsiE